MKQRYNLAVGVVVAVVVAVLVWQAATGNQPSPKPATSPPMMVPVPKPKLNAQGKMDRHENKRESVAAEVMRWGAGRSWTIKQLQQEFGKADAWNSGPAGSEICYLTKNGPIWIGVTKAGPYMQEKPRFPGHPRPVSQ